MAIKEWGQAFRVNPAVAGYQSQSTVAALKDGGFVVAWADDSAKAMCGQFLNADGTKRGDAFIVEAAASGNTTTPFDPQIAVLATGEVVISFGFIASNTQNALRAFSMDGEPLGPSVRLTSNNSAEHDSFIMTALSGGALKIAYDEYGIPNTRLMTISNGNVSLGPASANVESPSAFASVDDNHFAQIVQRGSDFWISTLDASGAIVTAPTLAHTTTAGLQHAPDLTRLENGNLVLTFRNNDEVRVQIMGANGAWIGSDFLVGTGNDIERPHILALVNGGFAIAYTVNGFADATFKIELFSATGQKTGSHVIENVAPGSASSLTSLADGRIAVSWDRGIADDTDIVAQILDPRTEAVIIRGSVFNDHHVGTEFGDRLSGFRGKDKLQGEAGDDTLTGGLGDDALFGGAGSDTAVFSGNQADYTMAVVDGKLVVTDKIAGRDGTDTLDSVRFLQFADATINGPNTAPSIATLSQTRFSETTPVNEAIATLSATDADGDKLTYEVSSDAPFAVRGDKLILTGPLDYEKRTSYALKVTTIDEAGARTETTVQVSVLNVIEANALRIEGTRAADYLAGENGNDTIYGAAGNDALNGFGGDDRLYGGLGKDKLAGGIGKDVFVFKEKADARKTHLDKIVDFNVKDDTIWLDNAVFKKLGRSGSETKPAALKSGYFKVGTAATDANDYIVYDKKKGILYYDADGNGAGKALQIATLTKNLKMTYKDFFVI